MQSIKNGRLVSEEFWILSFGSFGRIEILTVAFLTCVGRWGARTQSKDVMLQFNKDLFLFSLGEERNEEVDSHMGAELCCGHG